MNPRLKIIAPLAILGLGIAGVLVAVKMRPQVEPAPAVHKAPIVRVEEVESRAWQYVVRAHGTVSPRSESNLISQVAGTVTWVSPALASGGFFEEGEVLLRVDRADYEFALETARAEVARSESEYGRALKELERQKRLSDRSVASETRYDDAMNQERVTTAGLAEARARFEQAKRELERTEIRAPYAGRVRDEQVDVGEFVSRGSTLARLYAVDFAEVRLPIADAELRFLDLSLGFSNGSESAPAPEVVLRADFAGGEHLWRGRIVRTEGEIDAETRMVHVVARIDDPYGRVEDAAGDGASARHSAPLAVGLFVEAEILGRRIEGVKVLPRSVLREGDRVLVVDGEARMHYRKVEVLRRERERVVIGKGLEPGERVCVSPIQAVIDGMQVRVSGEPSAESKTARAESGDGGEG